MKSYWHFILLIYSWILVLKGSKFTRIMEKPIMQYMRKYYYYPNISSYLPSFRRSKSAIVENCEVITRFHINSSSNFEEIMLDIEGHLDELIECCNNLGTFSQENKAQNDLQIILFNLDQLWLGVKKVNEEYWDEVIEKDKDQKDRLFQSIQIIFNVIVEIQMLASQWENELSIEDIDLLQGLRVNLTFLYGNFYDLLPMQEGSSESKSLDTLEDADSKAESEEGERINDDLIDQINEFKLEETENVIERQFEVQFHSVDSVDTELEPNMKNEFQKKKVCFSSDCSSESEGAKEEEPKLESNKSLSEKKLTTTVEGAKTSKSEHKSDSAKNKNSGGRITRKTTSAPKLQRSNSEKRVTTVVRKAKVQSNDDDILPYMTDKWRQRLEKSKREK